ncbi:phage portal protein [Salininema proteolyticum]|uniref:Phage portal protein n=1 Tax=Salininema proteolyticum TaxID=1607685 RepID=A0ABV8TZC2_9ACTN
MSKPLAKTLLKILEGDSDRLGRIDDYLRGIHADPYIPQDADAEYRLLARRAVSNWIPLLVATPAQALYVDSIRRAGSEADLAEAEWEHWQYSRLDARQLAVHRAAIAYGHSFTVTEADQAGKLRTRGLSPLRTAAVFDDPSADEVPIAAMTVTSWPGTDTPGRARLWDHTWTWDLTFKANWDADSIRISNARRHGAPECPVTRFAAYVDLDGRTTGVVEPTIPIQDRINQTLFDLLLTQTYQSTQVRYATGMAPPIRRDPETGEPVLDAEGQPVPLPINHNGRRFLFAEDPDVRFGSLDATPLKGFLDAIETSVRHLAAISQVPPHHILGEVANLSAEALQSAENALTRKTEEFQNSFGESWERVFRLVADVEGRDEEAGDYTAEVLWRDMSQTSLAQSADGLAKLADGLGIPKRGLWNRVPGATGGEVAYWDRLARESEYQQDLTALVNTATTDVMATGAVVSVDAGHDGS